jgi:formylglycine-generating enzyme required for sulfatase activity
VKSIGLLAWVMVCLSSALTCAGAGGGQPLELNIQMVPGIWITGANGLVSIEYTTNLDRAGGWALLATVQATNSPYFFADATATNTPKRFYRAGNTSEPAVNPDPTHLVWINAGTFTMGSPTNEVDRNADEGPQTQVTITLGFWMSKYKTTQEEYLGVTGSNPSYFIGDLKRPVEQISWNDATNYCGKLTVRERADGRLPVGYVYRLPTEAEWEYACRAGTTTRFSYGDDAGYTQLSNYAWYWDNSYTTVKPSGVSLDIEGHYYTTHSVGHKKPNAWGLYDIHGNVWEWCLDWYSGSLPGGSVTDPRGHKFSLVPRDSRGQLERPRQVLPHGVP